MSSLIRELPKVELHMHIEGSLEPELMFDLARRNGLSLPYASIEEVRAAYSFRDLQSFLDIYYQGAAVLLQERDFYDMTWAYLVRAHGQNIRHVEIFFDPQTHTERGVAFETVLSGIARALDDAMSKWGMTSGLIMCFLRHLSQDAAWQTLQQARPYRSRIVGVGLDSSEAGHPPRKFADVFSRARELGFRVVAHAGEEGPADYIWQALDILGAERIDHGVRCTEDPGLVQRLREDQVPLTVCPLSNIRLKVFRDMGEHNLKTLLDQGLCVTVNSDDPAYFGGYLEENFAAVQSALSMDDRDLLCLAKNGVKASFLDDASKQKLLGEIASVAESFGLP